MPLSEREQAISPSATIAITAERINITPSFEYRLLHCFHIRDLATREVMHSLSPKWKSADAEGSFGI
jgi:hypothetical protein